MILLRSFPRTFHPVWRRTKEISRDFAAGEAGFGSGSAVRQVKKKKAKRDKVARKAAEITRQLVLQFTAFEERALERAKFL